MELRRYLEILWRRRWLFSCAFLLFFGTIAAWTYLATRVYEATAKVMLIESSTAIASFTSSLGVATSGTPIGASTTSKNYDTEIALATAAPVLEAMIADLQLKGRDGKSITPQRLVKSSLLNKLLPRPYVEVSELENSDILQISSYSADASEAARMSNALVRLFIKDRTNNIRKEFGDVRAFLQEDIKRVEKRYKDLLRARRDLLVTEKSIDLGTESKNLLDYIASTNKKLDDLLSDFAGKTVDLTPTHPDIVQLQKKIELARKSLNEKAQTELSGIPTKLMKQSEIDIVVSVFQDLYKKLLDYVTKLDIAESAMLSKISVVENATVPVEANFPKKLLNLLIGLVLGLFWAVVVALIVDAMDNTIINQEDLKDYRFPVLGQIPKTVRSPVLMPFKPGDPLADAYWQVLWSILEGGGVRQRARKLLVSGIGPQEGRTTSVANLGILHAQAGNTVLLIDADMHRPGLHTVFDLPDSEGLTDVVSGRTQIDRAIRESGVPGLSVLSRGQAPANAGMLITSDRMRELVTVLEQRFDLLIFDSAPLLIKNDALLLMRHMDDMVCVVKSNATTRPAIVRIDALLQQAQIAPRGLILNCVSRGEYYTFLPLFASCQEVRRSLFTILANRFRWNRKED